MSLCWFNIVGMYLANNVASIMNSVNHVCRCPLFGVHQFVFVYRCSKVTCRSRRKQTLSGEEMATEQEKFFKRLQQNEARGVTYYAYRVINLDFHTVIILIV